MTDCFILSSALFDSSAIVREILHATPLMIYLIVLGLMVVESSFIPFPSEVIVPPAAYIACTRHEVSIIAILLVATAGALIGALINYGLSLWIGRPIVYKFADSRIGHACLITPAKVEKAERYFDDHGAISTFIGRLIPAVRQLISIPAGLARMNLVKFIIFTSLGALVWNAVLAALGYWLGTIVKPDSLLEYIERYNAYLTYAGLALALICVAVIVYNFLKKPKHSNQ